MFNGFTKETSDFLWELSFNNERPWFQAHRDQYLTLLHEPFHALAEEILAAMQQAYPRADFTVHVSRIYRDARRLFGRGPYNDNLWFTIYGSGNHNEGPMFWFELSASSYRYGLGFFDITPSEMEAFRSAIDANPAHFERLAADAAKLRGFRLIGPEYKRPKKDLGPIINPWYNRKRVGLEHASDFDPEKLGPELVGTLFRAYRRLMPMYDFLFECYRSVQEHDADGLQQMQSVIRKEEDLS